MPLSVQQGEFALNTSTGTQAITDLGFTPKAIWFFGNYCTSDGGVADSIFHIGFADDSLNDYSVCAGDEDGQGSSDSRAGISGNALHNFVVGTGTEDFIFNIDSMDASGFTIDITNAPANDYIVSYIAVGDTDITNVKAGTFALTTGASQTVTGVGFEPDFLMMAAVGQDGALPQDGNHFIVGFGATDGTNERTVCGTSQNAQATSVTHSYQRNDACLALLTRTGVIDGYSSLNTFNGDGFVLDHDNTYADTHAVIYLAIKGGNWAVGNTDEETTAPTDFSVTGLSFQPSGLITFATGESTVNSVTNDLKLAFGAATSSTDQSSICCAADDNVGTTDSNSQLDRDEIHLRLNPTGGAVDGSAEFKQFNSDGFTLTQTDAGSSQLIHYIAIGPEAVAGRTTKNARTNPLGNFHGHNFRVTK